MDNLTKEARSRHMALIKSTNTKPELLVRRLIFSLGYRYRIHGKKLPGKPDLVFAGRKKVIFVHGCFWHRHTGCKKTTMPSSRIDYWAPKFARTIVRDASALEKLSLMGWKALVIWECEIKDQQLLSHKIISFLSEE